MQPFFAFRRWLLLFVGGCSVGLAPLLAEDRPEWTPEQHRFFELEVRPLLAEKCWACHGEKEVKGGLRLDQRHFILEGGESGAAAVSGDPTHSLLLEAVRYESLEMPPAGKLSDEQIAVLGRWVAMGLPWPGGEDQPRLREPKERFSDEDRGWWAIQPLVPPPVPRIEGLAEEAGESLAASWSRSAIDAFIWERMQSEGLSPAPEAERGALIRRLYLDLVGLPPTFEQVQAFVADPAADAIEKVVDDLLGSPRYGERWARHWLDLVRYADSDGYRADHYRPDAWRYRDYVIDSFNHDKPYDRFIQEQLAGDELFPGDPQALIATGFLRHWIYEYNSRDARAQWDTILNDITDTTSDVFLGLGLQCAKCHDHKFDPLLQQDYYRLQAFFAPISFPNAIVDSPLRQSQYTDELARWEQETAELRQRIDALEKPYREKAKADAIFKFPPDIQAILKREVSELSPREKQLHELAYLQVIYEYDRLDGRIKGDEKEELLALRKQLAAFDKIKPRPLATAMTACDIGTEAPEVRIPKRGQRSIAPGYPTLLDPREATIQTIPGAETTGRRATLASWMTDPGNPLTARVMVNRLWQYHFGRGLAANSSDFGQLGGVPSHPELLDWLASQFLADGWSIKQMHRRIVLSATYRQATRHPRWDEFQRLDPDNRCYWRGDTRRLEAEQIRDQVLMVTRQLRQADVVSLPWTEKRPGFPDRIEGGEGVMPDVPRRTIYTRIMRNARDPLLDVFDLPLFFSSQSARNTTTTPVQSLLLFNSSEMLRFAGKMAEQITAIEHRPRQQVEQAFRLAYARLPTQEELEASERFLEEHQQQLDASRPGEPWDSFPARPTAKLPYRDGQAVFVSTDKETPPLCATRTMEEKWTRWSVESYFQVRSISEDASVRTLVGKWSGSSKDPGWYFGVTGKGSRRKPQTLVLVMWGEKRDGQHGEAAVFSDQFVDLNKPYFAAATVEAATASQPGTVVFYLKDLSNDDEPIQVARVPHDMRTGLSNQEMVTIGGYGAKSRAVFDGLIDDVRLSKDVMAESRLLLTSENVTDETLAYWRFEADPGIMKDSSPRGGHLVALGEATSPPSAATKAEARTSAGEMPEPQASPALVDLCHALLNSNEFLYVD
jgi:hypothetical protein